MNMNLYTGMVVNSMDINELFVNDFDCGSDNYDMCWESGNYVGQYCPCCPYRNECSGYEDDD